MQVWRPNRFNSLRTANRTVDDSPNMPSCCPPVSKCVPFHVPSCLQDLWFLCCRLNVISAFVWKTKHKNVSPKTDFHEIYKRTNPNVDNRAAPWKRCLAVVKRGNRRKVNEILAPLLWTVTVASKTYNKINYWQLRTLDPVPRYTGYPQHWGGEIRLPLLWPYVVWYLSS
jgi:hypothetical protein